jgi:hypothetical protein
MEGQRGVVRMETVDRRALAAATGFAGMVLCGVVLSSPALTVAGLVVLCALAAPRRLDWDVAFAMAIMAALAVASVSGLVAGWADLDLSALPARTSLVAGVAVLLAAVVVLRGPLAPGPDVSLAAWAPAACAAALGVLQALSPNSTLAWALLGTDLAEHTIMLAEVREAGMLDYTADPYPRGLHALLAFVPPGAATSPEALLVQDLQTWGAASWLSLAACLLALTATTARFARLCGLSRRTAALACVGLGAAGFTDPVVETLVLMGAAPASLAVVVLLAGVLRQLSAAWAPKSSVLLPQVWALGVVAHLWQPLVLVPAGAALLVAWTARGADLRRTVLSAGGVLSGLMAGLLAVPALLGVVRSGGTGLAAIPGEISAPPLAVLGVALIALGARPAASAAVPALWGGLLGSAGTVAVLLHGAGKGLDLASYYPRKGLWFAVLLIAPLAAVVLVVVARFAVRVTARAVQASGPASRVARLALPAMVVAALIGFVLPQMVAQPWTAARAVTLPWDEGSSAKGRGMLALAADAAAREHGRVVVPVAVGDSVVFDPYSTYIVSKLMSYFTGQTQNHGRPHAVCDDVRNVAAGQSAVVVSRLTKDQLEPFMREGGCSSVPVVRAPGTIDDVAWLQYEASQE